MLKLGALVRFCLLSGAKRTWPSALHMSAFDPKRTYTRRSMSPIARGNSLQRFMSYIYFLTSPDRK